MIKLLISFYLKIIDHVRYMEATQTWYEGKFLNKP